MTVSSNATSVVTAWRNLGLNAAMSAFKRLRVECLGSRHATR